MRPKYKEGGVSTYTGTAIWVREIELKKKKERSVGSFCRIVMVKVATFRN